MDSHCVDQFTRRARTLDARIGHNPDGPVRGQFRSVGTKEVRLVRPLVQVEEVKLEGRRFFQLFSDPGPGEGSKARVCSRVREAAGHEGVPACRRGLRKIHAVIEQVGTAVLLARMAVG